MNRTRRIVAAVAAVAASALLALGTAVPAFAVHVPESGATGPQVVRTIVQGGMPGWQITLIAVGAALIASALTAVADRAKAVRRRFAAAA